MLFFESFVMKDRRVTVRKVAEEFDLSYGTAQEILTSKLELKCNCARWVPHLLLPEQKKVRVQICRELTSRYAEEGDGFLNKIVTSDKTWFHFFEPESKQESSLWKHATSPSPVKARLFKPVGKVICDTSGIVLNHMLLTKTTVNNEYYAHLIRVPLQ